MNAKKLSKKHLLGQYMTTEDVALEMCKYFTIPKEKWVVFDPTCGDGVLLEAAAKTLVAAGIPPSSIELYGFDIDKQMLDGAVARLKLSFGEDLKRMEFRHCDTLRLLGGDVFMQDENKLLDGVTVVIGNPPYGKGLEVKFFEACNSYFANRAELVFLLPMSFVDAIKGTTYDLLKGRPLGVTTGHVIVLHRCGNQYVKKTQKESLDSVNGFSVLTGVKLYAKGDGTPPQDEETLRTKPFSSDSAMPGWLPCLRTGDIQKFMYSKNRLWVDYGEHLAHPKEIGRFMGPRLFVRRVPIWACKSLGVTYIEETALCAGDVLVVRHVEDTPRLLKGLCVFLNSPEAAEFVISHRPSVGHRDSFPKISAKDLVRLLNEKIPSIAELEQFSESFR